MQSLTLYIDGAARGNPGPAGIGVVILGQEEMVLAEVAEYIGETTNNVAEYRALLRGLEEALHYGADEIKVLSDSQLLVRQINGDYQVKHPGLKPLYREAIALIRHFPRFQINHIPREKNKRADSLANASIDDERKEG
ncbi:MAG TPA: ribonuclease HI family protein [Firmicutes bacterium]|jgi:ribonuclease HI|nr:ribonuclease HI family protein [Bacillota bacterium]